MGSDPRRPSPQRASRLLVQGHSARAAAEGPDYRRVVPPDGASIRCDERHDFDGARGAVLVDIEVTTFGGFRYSDLSEDGATLYLGYSNRSYVVDLTSGGTSLSISTAIAALTGHAASSDVSRFAVGRLNMVRVFDRNTNGIYATAFDLTLSGPDAWCTRLAISADDRILAAGFSLSNNRDVRLLA